jgi:hypothetical protein
MQASTFQIEIVPADGTSAAKLKSGDFGTPSFYGQLSDKLRAQPTPLSGWNLSNLAQIENFSAGSAIDVTN